jgi:hypothetical protein
VDLERLQERMAATIEKAKADDPKELRRQIAELKKQIAAKSTSSTPPPKPTRVEVPVLKDSQIARLEKIYERLLSKADDYGTAMGLLWSQQAEEAKALLDVLRVVANVPKPTAEVHQFAGRRAEQPARTAVARTNVPGRPGVPAASGRSRPAPSGPAADDMRIATAKGVKKHVVAILTALAQHPDGLTREQTLILAGYQPSGDISTAFAGLLEHGWIVEVGPGLQITSAGAAALGPFEPLPTGEALRTHLLSSGRLNSAERKLLAAFFAFRDTTDHSATRAEVHQQAGLKPSGDTSTAIAKFLKLGWVVERAGGLMAADTFYEG